MGKRNWNQTPFQLCFPTSRLQSNENLLPEDAKFAQTFGKVSDLSAKLMASVDIFTADMCYLAILNECSEYYPKLFLRINARDCHSVHNFAAGKVNFGTSGSSSCQEQDASSLPGSASNSSTSFVGEASAGSSDEGLSVLSNRYNLQRWVWTLKA